MRNINDGDVAPAGYPPAGVFHAQISGESRKKRESASLAAGWARDRRDRLHLHVGAAAAEATQLERRRDEEFQLNLGRGAAALTLDVAEPLARRHGRESEVHFGLQVLFHGRHSCLPN